MSKIPPTLLLPFGHLLIQGGSRDGQRIPLPPPPQVLTLGRGPRNAISFHPTLDPAVSRQHAQLILSDEGVTLDDLGSSQGTYLLGARLTQRASLQPGDEIQLGMKGPRLTLHWTEEDLADLLEEVEVATPPTLIMRPIIPTAPRPQSEEQGHAPPEAVPNASSMASQPRALAPKSASPGSVLRSSLPLQVLLLTVLLGLFCSLGVALGPAFF